MHETRALFGLSHAFCIHDSNDNDEGSNAMDQEWQHGLPIMVSSCILVTRRIAHVVLTSKPRLFPFLVVLEALPPGYVDYHEHIKN
jgi:hypothetical protein